MAGGTGFTHSRDRRMAVGKESLMRNDVKLGLAVGGLLLGVVLAYALFFSNNSGDRDRDALASGRFGTVENGGSAEASRQQGSGAVETITDLSAPGNVGNNTGTTSGNIGQEMPPVTETSTPEATADAGTNSNTNVLTGRSWTE